MLIIELRINTTDNLVTNAHLLHFVNWFIDYFVHEIGIY